MTKRAATRRVGGRDPMRQLRDLSHELRTPLTLIKGYLEHQQTGVITAVDALEAIAKATVLLEAAVEDVIARERVIESAVRTLLDEPHDRVIVLQPATPRPGGVGDDLACASGLHAVEETAALA